MTMRFVVQENVAGHDEIMRHLAACDPAYYAALSKRVKVPAYVTKLLEKSFRHEAWHEDVLVGLLAVYYNDAPGDFDFITNVSVVSDHLGQGIASRLLEDCIKTARARKHKEIRLEVASGNMAAIALYHKFGFVTTDQTSKPGYTVFRLVL